MKKPLLYLITGCLFAVAATIPVHAQLFVDQKADMEFAQGNYAKALEHHKELAAQDKSGLKYLHKIGDAEFYLKNYAEAEKAYAKYLDKYTSPISVRLRYAQALLYQGNYDAARAQLAEFKNGTPGEHGAYADLLLRSIDYVKNAAPDTNTLYTIHKSDIAIGGLYLGGNSFRDALLTSVPKNAESATPGIPSVRFLSGSTNRFRPLPIRTASTANTTWARPPSRPTTERCILR